MEYGILEHDAPELSKKNKWIDADGKQLDNALQLSDLEGKFKIIYCFQSWCPGCHSSGLPALQKLAEAFKDNDAVQLMAVQTVFEGFEQNSYEKIAETQKQYSLDIPFGHDIGDESSPERSSIMYHYRTGGTPWFIFISEQGKVIFNDFHIHPENTIKFLQEYLTHLSRA